MAKKIEAENIEKMSLYDICAEIAVIEEGLYYGTVEFCYDNMMCAMKPGHPAEILDDILSIIGWDVQAGETPPLSKVKKTLTELRSFQRAFKVDLSVPINGLKQYIKDESEVI